METLLKFEYWVDFSVPAGSGPFLQLVPPFLDAHLLPPKSPTRIPITRRFLGKQKELLVGSGIETI